MPKPKAKAKAKAKAPPPMLDEQLSEPDHASDHSMPQPAHASDHSMPSAEVGAYAPYACADRTGAPYATLDSRPAPKHAKYGNGEYGQTPAETAHTSQCGEHACFDWQNAPFSSEHMHGLVLHSSNAVEMSESILQGWSVMFDMEDRIGRELWAAMWAVILVTKDAFLWFQMKTKAGYRGYMAKCKTCGRIAWCGRAKFSTVGVVDHEVADIMSFLRLAVPESLQRPLEQTVPQV